MKKKQLLNKQEKEVYKNFYTEKNLPRLEIGKNKPKSYESGLFIGMSKNG